MKEKKKLVFPGLCREPIKPLSRACTTHEGTGCLLEEVLEPRQENELGRFLHSRELTRERKRKKDMGTQASGGGRVL